MFKMLAEMLLNKQIKVDSGRIELMGHRDSFTPLDTYIDILKVITESKNEKLIYDSCKKAGYEWFQIMSEKFPGMRQMEAIKWGVDLVSFSGWGVPVLKKADMDKKTFIFILKNSTVAKHFGKTNKPIDTLFNGLVAGGMSYIVKTDLDSTEIKCVATGGDICEFVVSPKK
ncbi:MAG: 4-vinyl reductase [Candidatus Aenigmarchaeota archaeon]|nr:4-vinyl reductase [Candidatus Aenigmarchaeota archaeon]